MGHSIVIPVYIELSSFTVLVIDQDPYGGILQAAGYDDTSFLVGMAEDELQALGVSVKAHRQALLAEIRTLGDPDIEPFVPVRYPSTV